MQQNWGPRSGFWDLPINPVLFGTSLRPCGDISKYLPFIMQAIQKVEDCDCSPAPHGMGLSSLSLSLSPSSLHALINSCSSTQQQAGDDQVRCSECVCQAIQYSISHKHRHSVYCWPTKPIIRLRCLISACKSVVAKDISPIPPYTIGCPRCALWKVELHTVN